MSLMLRAGMSWILGMISFFGGSAPVPAPCGGPVHPPRPVSRPAWAVPPQIWLRLVSTAGSNDFSHCSNMTFRYFESSDRAT